VTIVRPSQTYDLNFPVAIGGGSYYTLADRLKKGRPIIVHGDGTSLWVLTHAEDFGRGSWIGRQLESDRYALHITSDEVLTWEQIYQFIAEALGVEANIVHIPSDFIARIEPELAGTLLGDKTGVLSSITARSSGSCRASKRSYPFGMASRRTLALVRDGRATSAGDETAKKRIEHILKAYVVNSAEGRVVRTPGRREALRGRDPGGSRSDP